jgi:peptidoglycan hydrolase-like protein with peptidoglycan-binding domain
LDVVREVVERPIERDATDLLMEMKATPRQLQLEFYVDDLKRSSGWIRETSYRPLIKLVKAEIRDRSALYKLSKLLTNLTKETRNDLGNIIVNTLVQLDLMARDRKIGDFHLDSLSPALAKIPWELATYKNKSSLDLFRYFYRSAEGPSHKSQSVRWLQLAVNDLGVTNTSVDGMFGPITQAALDTLRKKNKWPASLRGAALMTEIGELLVRNKPKRDTRALIMRSKDSKSRTRTSSMLDWIYNDCYFNVQTIDPGVDLKPVLAKFRPDVIHIECAFREVPGSGEIYLDFLQKLNETSSPDKPKFQPLSPSLLNHVLATAPDSKLRPLVILDARAPSTITEAVHQLFYRNAYAAQLFQAGQVSAVIAMGLTLNFDLYQKQLFELVSDLSNTRTFGEVTNSLRSSSQSSNLADKIGSEGIALFTNEPWLTVLTPERR